MRDMGEERVREARGGRDGIARPHQQTTAVSEDVRDTQERTAIVDSEIYGSIARREHRDNKFHGQWSTKGYMPNVFTQERCVPRVQ
jgi:hypothetical protein